MAVVDDPDVARRLPEFPEKTVNMTQVYIGV
jgi:hypothetical protein